MLSNIRNFSKTIFAKVLLVIIIIPFVFWGMGGVFSSGNTNSIVKINNHNISTQDFMKYLNNSRVDEKVIRENIDNKILEQLLSELVSITLLNMEIEDLKITVSKEALANAIKKNKEFLDEKGSFSRTEYEKFLLLQNLTAVQFEEKFKNNELRKKLFAYVSGGIKSPNFITNNIYKEQTAKLDLEFINLDTFYDKKENFTMTDIENYINSNKESLKIESIDFSYAKLTPKNLIGSNDFNELFFKKIDEIESKIINDVDFNQLINDLKITVIRKSEFIPNEKSNNTEKTIYERRNENKTQLIDENEFYTFYKIDKIYKKLPSIKNEKYLEKIKKLLYEKYKYDFNKKIFDKIVSKKFMDADFINLAKKKSLSINSIKLDSINDTKKFDVNSVKLLYSQAPNSFILISDTKENIFLAKIKSLTEIDISKDSNEYLSYNNQANFKIRDNMYRSYDLYIAKKYKVTINEKTLERVKNYFK